MVSARVANVLTYAGLILLLWSGYSSFFYFQILPEKSSMSLANLPGDVLVCLVLGVGLALFGSINSIADFKPVKGIIWLNRVSRDEFLDAPSFRNLYTRNAFLARRRSKE